MTIQQIRNATNKITFGGKTFLLDPWLAAKGSLGSFSEITLPGVDLTTPDPTKSLIPMPMCELPLSIDEILAGVDATIVTHIHPDHIDIAPDGTLGGPLDKRAPLFCQSETDAAAFRANGFLDVRVLTEAGESFGGVTLRKTFARHGTVIPCGDACGVTLEAEGEKRLYVAGDTVWTSEVQETLRAFRPDVIMLNACAAEFVVFGRLIMNDEDVLWVHRTCPDARLYITHMDTVPHATITRADMKGLLARRGITAYDMPLDGATVTYA